MGLLLAIIAFFCGLALIFNFGTGELNPQDVAGVGICCVALAILVGAAIPTSGWPWNRGP